ncbi:hypothetical protein MKW94_011235 [Papaver nudicaule]|uniref:Dof zinc finger protein n=1 Tax=Papaver nudicaule TaxID=74823 RepID=A0AA42B095_PAPNU|nr:hypothetical protein [Papaver nudicaule]
MLCNGNNSEKTIISSSTPTNTNEWSQRDENTGILMASNGNNNNRVMEKTATQEQQQQQQPHLKCPRCDSSNTKFCYYNNYSLTQPRHFCKACKRYWTRGGTLRNVPVGGGYRKNKRVKRPATASNNDTASSNLTTPTSGTAHHSINVSNNPNQMMHPLFYGLPTNQQSSYLNLSFPGYDPHHQSQLSSMGLSYPSIAAMTNNNQPHEDYVVGGGYNRTTHVQDLINSSSNSLSSFSLFGSSSPSPRTSASMVFNGTNKESRNNGTTYHQGLLPFQDLQMGMNDDNPRMQSRKEVKNEDGNNHSSNNEIGNNKVEWNNFPCQNQVGAADSSLFWNSNMTSTVSTVGTWPDLANYGSSVTSMI